MKLYCSPKSGHSHRARLFLALIGVDVELVEVNMAAREHKSDAFVSMNRFGQVPVLVDDKTVVSDSNAIMIYLARKFDRTDWYPLDAMGSAAVQRWLSVAAGQLLQGPASARLATLFGAQIEPQVAIDKAHALFAIMEQELAVTGWIAGDEPTIADIALYSYTARAPEGNVDLSVYTNIREWIGRIEGLPGFVPFVRNAVGLYAEMESV